MDFKAQYLQALRERDPKLFRQLTRSGELESVAHQQALAAEKMLRDLTADARHTNGGKLPLHLEREAEEYMRAELMAFQPETTLEEDELRALRGDRPILSSV